MMHSFKRFLRESSSNITIEDIARDCSEFLKSCEGLPIFRGIRPSPDYAITLHKTRTDRVPRDLNKAFSARLDVEIEKIVGFKTRSAGTFATGDSVMANEYGTLCLVFPKNGFEFAWSPDVKDPFVNFQLDDADDAIKTAKKSLIQYHLDRGNDTLVNLIRSANTSSIINKMAELADNGEPEILNTLSRSIAKNYRNDGLVDAIKSRNELIFNGDYYAVTYNDMDALAGKEVNSHEFMELLIGKM